MDSRTARFHKLMHLAKSREAELASALKAQSRVVHEEEARLQVFINYQQEYVRARRNTSAGRNVNHMRLQNNFIRQLDDAATQQLGKISREKAIYEQKKAQWQRVYQSYSALRKIYESCLQEELKTTLKLEQRFVDEINNYRYQPPIA